MAEQPERSDRDGEVSVHRLPNGDIMIAVVTDNERASVVLTDYNGWRIFGLLAFMLGIGLPTKLAKKIKL
jgi:hypothetical protein